MKMQHRHIREINEWLRLFIGLNTNNKALLSRPSPRFQHRPQLLGAGGGAHDGGPLGLDGGALDGGGGGGGGTGEAHMGSLKHIHIGEQGAGFWALARIRNEPLSYGQISHRTN